MSGVMWPNVTQLGSLQQRLPGVVVMPGVDSLPCLVCEYQIVRVCPPVSGAETDLGLSRLSGLEGIHEVRVDPTPNARTSAEFSTLLTLLRRRTAVCSS